VKKPAMLSRLFFPIIIIFLFFMSFLCSLSVVLSRVLLFQVVYRSDEDRTFVVMARNDRGMILGRHSLLVKFAVELLRRRCQINRGKALLSRSNRQRRETRDREDRANSAATCPRSLRRSWK